MSSETKNRGGRPPFEPTEKQRIQVETLAAVGTPQETIAEIVGIGHGTLAKYFGQELKDARSRITAKIGSMLATQALSGDKTCQIFWLKTQGGWSERVSIDAALRPMTDEEIARHCNEFGIRLPEDA